MTDPAETVRNAKSAVRLLELAFIAMIVIGGIEIAVGNAAAGTNFLLLAVILRGIRQDVWISSIISVVGQTLKAPFRKVAAAAGKDPYSEPFGDMPNVGKADDGKDSTKH
jgi:hypothetical protein